MGMGNNIIINHTDQSMDQYSGGEDDDHHNIHDQQQQQLETSTFHHHDANSNSSGGRGGYLMMMQCSYYVESPVSTKASHSKTPAATFPLSSPARSYDTIPLAAKDKSIEEEEEEEEEEDYNNDGKGGGGGGWWWRFCSLRRRRTASFGWIWIWLQLSWRFMVSLGVALLVFYLATNPPTPNLSIKVAGINEFGLGEGVDTTGVTTKILTTNCSLDLVVDNKSELFGLHIGPPILEMSFARLPFAVSRGSKLYVDSHHSTSFRLFIGTKNKPMYGAGRNMQDFIESGRGLPIHVRVRLSSYFRVVWNIIRPKFHHKFECMLLLHKTYDRKHRTQTYHSTCITS